MPTYGVRVALALLEALHAVGLALLLRRLAPLCTALCRREALAALAILLGLLERGLAYGLLVSGLLGSLGGDRNGHLGGLVGHCGVGIIL